MKPGTSLAEQSLVSATDAKNEFGQMLEKVIQGKTLFITKHGDTKAVLMPKAEYDALSSAVANQLDTLTHEFDSLLLEMQTPKSRSAMKAAFNASAKQMGKAAVSAANSRR